MAAIEAVIVSSTQERTEFRRDIDKTDRKEHFRQLHEGLVKVQKDLNDKLTDYVNEEKAVNGSGVASKVKHGQSDSDGEEEDGEDEPAEKKTKTT